MDRPMHTISVTVRTLDGRKADLVLPEDAHIQEVRSAAEAELNGSFRLLIRGTEVPGVETLSSLGLGPHEFLVALPVRKRKASKLAAAGVPGPPDSKPIAGGAAPSAEPAANVAAEMSTPDTGAVDHQPRTAASYSCQAVGSPISHSQATAVEEGVQALSPSAQMGSPAHDDSRVYTLLPGYVSRPNPSPHKRQRAESFSKPEGGFVHSHSQGLQADVLEQRGEAGAGGEQGQQATTGGRGNIDSAGQTSAPGSPQDAQQSGQLPKQRAASAQPSKETCSSGLQAQASDKRVLKDRQRTNRQRRVPDPKEVAMRRSEDSLWAELAQELQQAQQRAGPPQAASQQMLPLAEAAPAAGDINDGLDQLQRVDPKAKKLLLALASNDDPVLSRTKQAAKQRKSRSTAKKRLPGGHDIRLTVQGRLTAQEAAAVAQLPLSPALDRLERIFEALNTVYCFLQMKNIQANWSTLSEAIQAFPDCQDASLDDIARMARLCPEVVFLQDTRSPEGPRSIKEFNRKLTARRSSGDADGAVQAALSQKAAPGESVSDDPLHVHSDAADLLPHHDSDFMVVEISDGSRHSVVAIARAMSKTRQQPEEAVAKLLIANAAVKLPPQPPDDSRAPSSAAAAGSPGSAIATQSSEWATEANDSCDGPAVHVETETGVQQEAAAGGKQSVSHSEEEEGEGGEQQRERGIRNATTRRRGAFRRGLVRCVMLMHDTFMADRGAQADHSGGAPPTAAGERSDHGGSPVSSPAATGKQVHSAGGGAAAEAVRSMLDDESEAGTTAARVSQPGDAVRPQAGAPQAPMPSLPELEAPQQLQPHAALEAERVRAESAAEDIPVLLPVPKRSRKAAKEQPAANKAEASQAQARGFDPLREGCWHPQFRFAELSLESVAAAAVEAARKQAIAEQQGWRRNSWEGDSDGKAARPPRLSRKHDPCRDCTHMSVDQYLQHLRTLPWYAGQVAYVEDLPTRIGAYRCPSRPLSEASQRALRAKGFAKLFEHQAEAIDAATAGRHVVVSTSTASGKSLCYNIPVIEAVAANPAASAIYIFPTKALAQDQLRALKEFVDHAFLGQAPVAEVYDGDTPQEDRAEIRNRAQLLITNPDMLHQSILPVHRQFSRLLSNLRYVVVDEGHAYRGVFGCHTALVLRRLRRVCQLEHKSSPTFVVASATIANPRDHVMSLLGVEDVVVISKDGSPHGPQRFVLWNPPLTAPNYALAAANGVQMSRTEGRARKAERKRATRMAVRKAVENASSELDLEDTHEANISLALAAARIHKRRNAVACPDESDRPIIAQGASGTDAVEDAQIEAAQAETADHAADPHQLATEEYGSSATKASSAAAGAGAVPASGSLGMHPSKPVINSTRTEPSTAAEQAHGPPGSRSEAVTGSMVHSAAGAPDQPGGSKLRRRQLSKEAIQAAMVAPGSTGPEQPGAAALPGSGSGAEAALQAVSSVANIRGELPKFEPKDIAFRSDEPGSSSGRPLLRRRLHGQRYGQKAGRARPEGQYAHSAEVQARMPGKEWRTKEFKDKWGTAGVSLDQRRKSPIVEISMLLAECVQHGLRTIAFCRTRKLCELVITYTREMLRASAPHLAHAISVYRAGYSPTERREIEKALFNGDLFAVAATNALELGVDVGSLDMTMHLGFQGSIASFRQQAGRAGRREQQSMSIYVAFDGPLDQYFMTYPRQLFDRPIEAAHIDPSNLILLEQHLACAAAESPLVLTRDERYFGRKIHKAADTLVLEGLLGRHPMAVHAHALHYIGLYDNPAARFSLRAIDPDRYQIVNEAEGGYVMEEIEESKAFFQVYDGAVYMFQGRTYLCKKLDLTTKTAIVRPVDVKYYTSIREHVDINVVGGRAAYPSPETILKQLQGDEEPTMAQCAEAEVTTRWLGFHRIRHGTGEIFDTVDLFLPDVQFPTQAAYLRVPQTAKATLGQAGLPWREGLHAAMHAILNVVPLHMMCGIGDLGAECDNPYSARFRPDRLLLFDKHPGGIGLAFKVCDLFGVLMRKAMALIEACPCTNPTGCPGCVQHLDCSQYNAVLNKQAGVLVLQATLDAQSDFRKRLAERLPAAGCEHVSAAQLLQAVLR